MLKVVIIVVYQVITVCYAEPAIVTIARQNGHSNYVTLNLTNGFSASADSSFLCRDDASRSHYHVSHSHCYSACRGYSKFSQLPAYFRYLVKCNRYTIYSRLTLAFLIPNIRILLSLQTLYPFQKLSGCNCTI